MTKMTSSTSQRIASIKNRLRLPAICAPMFLVTGPDMVISACKSGVLGTFPATNARTEEQLVRWLDQISTSITKADAPWALNMITHNSYGRFNAEEDVKIISATHINGKANFFAHPNSSPNTKTATKNISVGAMYCNIAMVESLSNFAPFA